MYVDYTISLGFCFATFLKCEILLPVWGRVTSMLTLLLICAQERTQTPAEAVSQAEKDEKFWTSASSDSPNTNPQSRWGPERCSGGIYRPYHPSGQ